MTEWLSLKDWAEKVEKLEEQLEESNRKFVELQKENSILYEDRNEAFKLWDIHKYKIFIAIHALDIYSRVDVLQAGVSPDIALEALSKLRSIE